MTLFRIPNGVTETALDCMFFPCSYLICFSENLRFVFQRRSALHAVRQPAARLPPELPLHRVQGPGHGDASEALQICQDPAILKLVLRIYRITHSATRHFLLLRDDQTHN